MKADIPINETKFNDIFTNYESVYEVAQDIYSKEKNGMLGNYLSTFCLGFIHGDRFDPKNPFRHFYNTCLKLGRYLYYIQNLDELVDRIRNCIYFCYKLKKEINKYYDDPKGVVSSYKKYNELPHEYITDAKTFSYVCPRFIDYPGDVTLIILKHLENIQKIIEKFDSNHGDGNPCMVKYEEYMNSLNKYNSNESFNSMLEYIENSYKSKCPTETVLVNLSEIVQQITQKADINTIESTINTEETIVLSMKEPNIRVNIGTFFLISVILIAIFILFKVKNKIW